MVSTFLNNIRPLIVPFFVSLVSLAGVGFQTEPLVGQESTGPYPNELPQFRFYQTSAWSGLKPLVSSMEDVRKLLGQPQEEEDVSQFTKPYPGDREAKQPVFTYRITPDWEMLVYFCKYCFHSHPSGVAGDRLCSIDLIPMRRIPFRSIKFPSAFRKKHVDAVDAGWDEYSDGSGLRYEVYASRPPYGNQKPGDLYRISYGPSMKGSDK